MRVARCAQKVSGPQEKPCINSDLRWALDVEPESTKAGGSMGRMLVLALLVPLAGGVAHAQARAPGASKTTPVLNAALKRASSGARDMTKSLKAAEGLPPSVQALPGKIAGKAATLGRELDADGATVR